MPVPAEEQHRRWMARALRLARRGWGRTSPNPLVGCVVVRGERVVGEGFHRAAGQPHAEIEALGAAGPRARGATLYCNLEPCSHRRRTPPCAEAVAAAGVRRVVAAMEDPNPLVSGRGLEFLRCAGVEVLLGTLAGEAVRLNEPFARFITSGLPFLRLKAAVTLDGRLAAAGGRSQWISGPEARRLVHRWRLGADAVMVGRGTVLADDPQLTPRPPGGGREWSWKRLTRVVLDGGLALPLRSRLLATLDRGPVLVFASPAASRRREEALRRAGAEVIRVPLAGRPRRLSLPHVLRELGRRQLTNVLLEGGAALFAAALEAGVVDRVALFYSPRLLGGRASLPLLDGLPGDDLERAVRLEELSVRRVGGDLLVEGRVVREAGPAAAGRG